jgi:hypothetical protein
VLAAAGDLSTDGLAALSVARWRTGELTGGAEAAAAHLAAGGDDGGALVVAAEAAARDGRGAEAAGLVERAVSAGGGLAAVEAIVAGLSPRAPWPGVDGASAGMTSGPVGVPAATEPRIALDSALDDLAAGRPDRAAVRLALILRRRPDLAAAVVDAIGDRAEPALELVRGDALRAVGRAAEAERAYAAAAAGLERPGRPARPRGER